MPCSAILTSVHVVEVMIILTVVYKVPGCFHKEMMLAD